MDHHALELTRILWDYMRLNQAPNASDFIVGFGCYNEDVARRCAELYRQGYAPKIIFSGGLGRNTKAMWTESEAERFARIAIAEGVPTEDILLENRSANSGENLCFTRELAFSLGFLSPSVIGVQKPYMERRLFAAFPVYWPEARVTVTSWSQSLEDYLEGVARWGRTPEDTVSMIVGDVQRIRIYAEKGFQLPQMMPADVEAAMNDLIGMGFRSQLVRE